EVRSLLGEHDQHAARVEGESAKQPVIPPSPRSVVTSQETSVGPTTSPDPSCGSPAGPNDGDEMLTPAERAPFLPGARVDGDSKRRTVDDFQRKQDPGPKRKVEDKGTNKSSQVTQHIAQRTHAAPRYPDEAPRAAKRQAQPLFQSQVRKQRRIHSRWLWLAAIVPTALVGLWMDYRVNAKLHEVAEEELVSVANSVQVSVEQFLKDQSRLVNTWGHQDAIRDAVLGLLSLPANEESREQLIKSPFAASIRRQLTSASGEDEIKYVVWDRTGRIIASWLPDASDIGGSVPPDGAVNLARAMRGETVLFGPEILQQDQSSGFIPETDRPVMAGIIPIDDGDGHVVATMLIRGFGMFDAFDALFRRATAESTLDVYAVNREGFMISNSSNALDVLAEPQEPVTGDPFVACRLRVSDPSGSSSADRFASQARNAQQLTLAAAGVLLDDPKAMLEPYRNYAGQRVIGAWRTVSDEGIGIIVERSASSAFAAARYVRFGFLGLGIWLSLTVVAAASQLAKQHALAKAAVHPLSRYKLIDELGSGGM
ncbi:MAG: hypothetical protein AAGJ83_15590, partial [Planctomycetota bacterium]